MRRITMNRDDKESSFKGRASFDEVQPNEMMPTVLVENTTLSDSSSSQYLNDIDRKISDIEQSFGNRRYDSVVMAFISCTSNFKNMNQAVGSLSNVVKQQHKQIHEYKSTLKQYSRQLDDCKDKLLSISGLNNAFILELSMRDMEIRSEHAIREKLQSDLVHVQSMMDALVLENEKLKVESQRDREDSTMSNMLISHEELNSYCTNTGIHCNTSLNLSSSESCHHRDTVVVSPSDSILESKSYDGNASMLKKENIELKATNKALVKTISRQETRLRKEYVRQQKLESLVNALQSQLQEMKVTRELEDLLKDAVLNEITGDYNREDNRPTKSLVSMDPSLSLEEKVRLLESALKEEKNYTVDLRRQLDTATRYLQDDKNREILPSPRKIPYYHRTVIMESTLSAPV